MHIIRAKNFTAHKAWGALNIACMQGITTRLHWSDKAYHWHINDGEEVFVVLDGQVTMHYVQDGKQLSKLLESGDIFFASVGTEHYADPIGEARVLVIEKQGSI
ncbi:cupin domain-containing protein [uncultured Paraglaciecola sp.]|uniref:cupin domain-containing protein n=1 Tax=uncultured Paraglaciecola sp. TaxID=1765024 RepID=UPI0030DD7064|tara:strand:- start:3212 stop:3523 length:312 start_codon:yes stop_codon:yes gene_type:complete